MASDRRKNFRVQWNTAGRVVVDGRTVSTCIIHNLSNGGAHIKKVISTRVPDHFDLHFADVIAPRRCHVSWRRSDEVGVEFESSEKANTPKAAGHQKKARRREPVA